MTFYQLVGVYWDNIKGSHVDCRLKYCRYIRFNRVKIYNEPIKHIALTITTTVEFFF